MDANLGLQGTCVQCNDVIPNMHSMHLAGIDLNLAVILHALLSERSVSKAARRVGLSQSATSHALARLRKVLGDPLLVRSSAGLSPTPRAQGLAQDLATALSALEQALGPPPGFEPKSTQRRFHLGAADYAEFVLLPPLLDRLAREAPGIDIWVRPFEPDIDAQLQRGDYDLALGLVRPKGHAPGVCHRHLFDERFVCLVRKGHPLTRGRLTLSRFTSARHAFIAPGGRPGGAVDEALAALGLERRIALAVPHFLVAPHVVARTDLVLTVAERIAREFVKLLPLQILNPPVKLPGFTISVLWHERTDRDPGQKWLRDQLGELGTRN